MVVALAFVSFGTVGIPLSLACALALANGIEIYFTHNHALPNFRYLLKMRREAVRSIREVLAQRLKLDGVDWGYLAALLFTCCLWISDFESERSDGLVVLCIATVAWLALVVSALFAMRLRLDSAGGAVMDMPRTLNATGVIPWALLDGFILHRPTKIEINSLPLTTHEACGVRRSLIVIQMESVDTAALESTTRVGRVMPFLYRLSQKARYFPHCLSHKGAGGTSDVEIAALNGIVPSMKSPLILDDSWAYPTSIVKVLANNGYFCFAAHGNNAAFYKRGSAYKRMGFHEFWDRTDMGLSEFGWGARDEDVLQVVDSRMCAAKRPFFGYVITMSSHTPFTYVQNYGGECRQFPDVVEQEVRNYFESMAYLDAVLEAYVEKWLNEGCSVVLFGDHGAGIRNQEFTSSELLTSLGRIPTVPLLVCEPGNAAMACPDVLASTLDVAPTLLDLSAVSYQWRGFGESVLKTPLTRDIPYHGCALSRKDVPKVPRPHRTRIHDHSVGIR